MRTESGIEVVLELFQRSIKPESLKDPKYLQGRDSFLNQSRMPLRLAN